MHHYPDPIENGSSGTDCWPETTGETTGGNPDGGGRLVPCSY